MERSKFFLASRGIVGGLVPLVFGALILFGYQIEPGMQTEAIGLGNEFLDMLVEVADGVALLSAGILSLWSRLRTERRPLRAELRPQ